jgi:hypothetical protein
MHSAVDNLSIADERTLHQVFDPESAPASASASITIDANLPPDPQIKDLGLLKELKKRELEAIKLVESHSDAPKVSFANSHGTNHTTSTSRNDAKHQVYIKALEILDLLTTQHPKYASAYNNRAQLRRWRYGDDLISISALQSSATLSQVLDDVLGDLDTAISLSSPPPSDGRISAAQAKLLGQAWMQKGALFWGMSRQHTSQQSADESSDSHEFKASVLKLDQSQLEEEGNRCFFMAGLYGNEAGRGLAVRTNPYARLCGSIVKEAMKREGVV